MTTRQNEITRIYTKLRGHAPDEKEVAALANIAEAVEIKPGDALFPLMLALDTYQKCFDDMPEKLKEATGYLLQKHAEALKAEAEKIEAEQNVAIQEKTRFLLGTVVEWLQKNLSGVVKAELEKVAGEAVKAPVQAAAERLERLNTATTNLINELYAAKRQDVWERFVMLVGSGTIGAIIVLLLKKFLNI
jgi:FtsZ-binding cell division protein ZapB